jgi:hypothetical protein
MIPEAAAIAGVAATATARLGVVVVGGSTGFIRSLALLQVLRLKLTGLQGLHGPFSSLNIVMI